jgi:ABC-type sugar transport system ATPase subunit
MIYVTHDQAEAMTLADRVVVLDQGRVQQVDRPMAVYEQPCNRFVAGFLGWPVMNFLDGRLQSCDGRLCLVAPSCGCLSVPDAWAAYAGQAVTLGIRPEDIYPVGDEGLAMEIVLIEALGHATLVTCRRNGWQLTARLPGRWACERENGSVKMGFHMEQAHLFDRAGGVRLNHRAAVAVRTG